MDASRDGVINRNSSTLISRGVIISSFELDWPDKERATCRTTTQQNSSRTEKFKVFIYYGSEYV